MISVYIKKLEESATIPTRATDSDAGYDLYSINDGIVPAGGRKVVGTGIAIAIPPPYYGRVAPRSGLAVKKGIDVLAGVIDSGYRNEIGVVLINLGGASVTLPAGTRIAQIIIEKCHEVEWNDVEELAASNRGQGGFGSTGT